MTMLFTRFTPSGTAVQEAQLSADRTTVQVTPHINGLVWHRSALDISVDDWPGYAARLTAQGSDVSIARVPDLALTYSNGALFVGGTIYRDVPVDGDSGWVDRADDALTRAGATRISDWWVDSGNRICATGQRIVRSEVPADVRPVVLGALSAAQDAIDIVFAGLVADPHAPTAVGAWMDRLDLSGDPTQVGYRDRLEHVASSAWDHDYPPTLAQALTTYSNAVVCAGRGETVYAVGRALNARFSASGQI